MPTIITTHMTKVRRMSTEVHGASIVIPMAAIAVP